MGKKMVGVVAAGVAMALLGAGQPAVAEEAQVWQPDPKLAWLADPGKVDWVAVARDREARSKARAEQTKQRTADATPLRQNEKEAVGTKGANDTPANAEHVTGFGTRKNPKAVLTGDLAPDTSIPTLPPFAETNDAIPLASDTGVAGSRPAARTSGTIGDGPHGSAGDKTGDFDFYQLSGGSAAASVTFETRTPTGDLDTFLVLYDAQGNIIDFNDNTGSSTDSKLVVRVQPGANLFVMVGGYRPGTSPVPNDPTKPGTGGGVGTEGPYDLKLSAGAGSGDKDYFSVDLRAGDVLGASVAGGGERLAVHDSSGREVFGSSQDLSMYFATNTPMPGGGNAVVDFVAPTEGRYTVGVEAGEGPYEVTVEAYRPGTETTKRGSVHTLYLDFDGARVNTSIFGGPAPGAGVRNLSGLSKFLPGWGLTAKDENAVIDAVVATVKENIQRDLAAKGTNHDFAVRILNSRDHADPWGQPNVSRVVVGGTIAESGIQTIGIAQSIDAGNFGKEDTALVLLDILSGPASQSGASLNRYLTPASDKIRFIGQAVGNIVAHEAGHFSGSWHTDGTNTVHGLMDPGGNPAAMFGVGPDGVGGTADDVDVDFIVDQLSPFEGFTGTEDTVNRLAWAFVRGKN